VSWRQLGAAPAGESEARRLGTAMVELAEGAGLRVSLEPTLVLGGTVVDVGPVERLPAWDGAELTWRGRSVEGGVDAGRALEAARDLSERSVLELNRGLEEVLSLSQQQCTEVEGLARTFDTTGGLGVALTALEGELSTVGQRLSGVLSGHLVEVGSAAASAHLDLTTLQGKHPSRQDFVPVRSEKSALFDGGSDDLAVGEMAQVQSLHECLAIW
jgi:hypothetical protein